MSKSTAHLALAALTRKYRAKIVEVGQLKNQLKADAAQNPILLKTQAALVSADELSNAHYENAVALAKVNKTLRAEREDALQIYRRLLARHNETWGKYLAAKGSVENWKSLSVVLTIVGVIGGALSMHAYATQVGL